MPGRIPKDDYSRATVLLATLVKNFNDDSQALKNAKSTFENSPTKETINTSLMAIIEESKFITNLNKAVRDEVFDEQTQRLDLDYVSDELA